MNRKEHIDKAAWEYAQSRSENRGIAYLTFKEIAEWADRTMICKARDWLQDVDFEDDYVTTDSDGRTVFADKFIEKFCKAMEE